MEIEEMEFANLLNDSWAQKYQKKRPYDTFERASTWTGSGSGDSVLELRKYLEPWPESLAWLKAAGAQLCDRPTTQEPDGVLDFEQIRRDEQLIEETKRRSQEPERRFTRGEVRELFGWNDHDLNYAVDLKLLPPATPQFVRDNEQSGGRART